jgi:ABC-2 type transport system ATP-binding protein
MTTAIEIVSMSKTYGDFKLQDVSFALAGHSILGLIGQNGAGKTTLFHCILDLVRRDDGRVCLPGHDRSLSRGILRCLLGYVPEKPIFYEWMTAAAALRFTSRFFASWDHVRCGELLRRWKLDADRPIYALSTGMRRKLSLIQALATRPRILFLDEPTSGLDPIMKFHFLQELRRLVDAGETEAIVISSHNLDEIERLVDSIAILKLGALQCHEPRQRFLSSWRKIEFVPPADANWRFEIRATVHSMSERRVMIVTNHNADAIAARLEALGATMIEVRPPSLQEIFLQVA